MNQISLISEDVLGYQHILYNGYLIKIITLINKLIL